MVDSVTGTLTERRQDGTSPETATDRELLDRFLAGDKAAFTLVVQRHTALVMNVCQRVLRRPGDAEDAFQATFLVLARKANSVNWRDSIAGWLHQTARRTALKLRAMSARRRDIEGEAAQQRTANAESRTASPAGQLAIHELGEILDSELAALPDRFREVILLAQVEGLSRDEVAERLGITPATVKDRLERGREQLRSRLLRRGITLTSAALAAWLIPGTAQAASLTSLAATTSYAAGAFTASSLASGVSPTAASLAQGVLKMMSLEKLKYAMVCAVSFLTAGGIAFGILRDDPTRFEKGLRGQVVAVNAKLPTVTISIEEFGTLLNLDVSPQAKVWTAFESGRLNDLKEGQYVSLRIGDDHRTVNEIHVQGQMRDASIKSIAPSGKIVIVEEGDDEEGGVKAMEVELAPDAILRIGGLPATRSDLKPGMNVPLEFGRDGKLVNAIEADAPEHTLLEGELLEVDAQGHKLVLGRREDNDDGLLTQQSFVITAETIITLDGKPSKLADLQRGCSVKLRLSDDGQAIRAIRAAAPEVEDDEPGRDDR